MKPENQEMRVIDLGNLIGEVENYKNKGYRLVNMSCTKAGEEYEINYSFELDFRFENIRMIITHDTDLPSISGIYWGAFIYENEMHDLFGIHVRGMNIDFKGNLIRTSVPYPFSNLSFKGEGPCQNR